VLLDSTHPVYRIRQGEERQLLDWQKNYLLKENEVLMVGTDGPLLKVAPELQAGVTMGASTSADPALGQVEEQRVTTDKVQGVSTRLTIIGGAILILLAIGSFVGLAFTKEDEKNRTALKQSKEALDALRKKNEDEQRKAEAKNAKERDNLKIEEQAKRKEDLKKAAEQAEIEREKLKQKLKEDYEKKLKESQQGFEKELTKLKDKSKKVTKQLEKLGPEMLSHLQNIGQSVYLVTFSTANGIENGLATAWVAETSDGERVLLTNGHVSKFIEQQIKRATSPDAKKTWSSAKLWVRSPGEKSTRLEVVETITHPGYDKLHEIIRDFGGPVRKQIQVGSRAGYNIRGVSYIPGYDVAMLIVKDPKKLRTPLPIEQSLLSPKDVKKKLSFELVGMAGYPLAEGSSLLKTPALKYRRGFVSGVSNFFYGDLANHNVLIQHTIATEGGSSGSPVINKNGRVVAIHSAGLRGKADLNYAQCISQVSALLKARALRDQAKQRVFLKELEDEVDKTWRKAIRSQFESRVELDTIRSVKDIDKDYRLQNEPRLKSIDKAIADQLTVMRKDVKEYQRLEYLIYTKNPRLLKQMSWQKSKLDRDRQGLDTTLTTLQKKEAALNGAVHAITSLIEALNKRITDFASKAPTSSKDPKDKEANAEMVKKHAASLMRMKKELRYQEKELTSKLSAASKVSAEISRLQQTINNRDDSQADLDKKMRRLSSENKSARDQLKKIGLRNGRMNRELYKLKAKRRETFDQLKKSIVVKIVDKRVEDLILRADSSVKKRQSATLSLQLPRDGVYYVAAIANHQQNLDWDVSGAGLKGFKNLYFKGRHRFGRIEVRKDQALEIKVWVPSLTGSRKTKDLVRVMVYRSE
ncbi:MAG: trypsin-like peptidase domain-containing protein, partial [Planctomycetota bacterium]|nr:trypsin-like peptidase domain-containing protein [Planctomycetota bacterium]